MNARIAKKRLRKEMHKKRRKDEDEKQQYMGAFIGCTNIMADEKPEFSIYTFKTDKTKPNEAVTDRGIDRHPDLEEKEDGKKTENGRLDEKPASEDKEEGKGGVSGEEVEQVESDDSGQKKRDMNSREGQPGPLEDEGTEQEAQGKGTGDKEAASAVETGSAGEDETRTEEINGKVELEEDELESLEVPELEGIFTPSEKDIQYFEIEHQRGLGMAIQEMVSLFESLCKFQQSQIIAMQQTASQLTAKEEKRKEDDNDEKIREYVDSRIGELFKLHEQKLDDAVNTARGIVTAAGKKKELKGQAEKEDQGRQAQEENDSHQDDTGKQKGETLFINSVPERVTTFAETTSQPEVEINSQQLTVEIPKGKYFEDKQQGKEESVKPNDEAVEPVVDPDTDNDKPVQKKGIFRKIRKMMNQRKEKAQREQEERQKEQQLIIIREALFRGSYTQEQSDVIRKAVRSGLSEKEIKEFCDPEADAAMMEIYLELLKLHKQKNPNKVDDQLQIIKGGAENR